MLIIFLQICLIGAGIFLYLYCNHIKAEKQKKQEKLNKLAQQIEAEENPTSWNLDQAFRAVYINILNTK